VLFYKSTGCERCEPMLPLWERLAYSSSGQYKVAKIDYVNYRNIFNIDDADFPVVLLFKHDKVYPYSNFSRGRGVLDNTRLLYEFVYFGYEFVHEDKVIWNPLPEEPKMLDLLYDLAFTAKYDFKTGNYFSRSLQIIFIPIFIVTSMAFVHVQMAYYVYRRKVLL
jgi:hypothetical protein